MSIKCKPDDLFGAMDFVMEHYAHEVENGVENACDDIAEQGKALLEQTARSVGIGGKKYVKGFRVKKEEGRISKTNILYNKEYRLTHLLEYGHPIVTQMGHKVSGKNARAYPHWEKCEEQINELYERKVERVCQG